jgi:hypothetical protein
VFGGCCQWVLDAVCETVEWLSQPLGFDSLALRSHSTKRIVLDNAAERVMLKVFRRRRSVPRLGPRLTIGAVLFVPNFGWINLPGLRQIRLGRLVDPSGLHWEIGHPLAA